MPSQPPGNLLWHLTLQYTLHAQRCQNGFYFTNKNSLDDSPAMLGPYTQAIANGFNTRMLASLQAFQNQQVVYNHIVVSTLIPHEGPIGELDLETLNGFGGDESLPSYCAAILTLRTGFSGKSNRGRLYIAGINEDSATASRLTPDGLAGLTYIGNQLLANYGATGSDPDLRYVMYSKKVGYGTGPFYGTSGIRPVTHIVPRSVLGTQRHRLIGKGT